MSIDADTIYGREEKAEGMLQIRALVLTNRWDERLDKLYQPQLRDSRTEWHWLPQDMRPQTECATPPIT